MTGATIALAAARLAPMALVSPALGRGLWPRVVVAVVLVAAVAANLPAATTATATMVARELAVGLVLAVAVAAPFWAAELAGALVDRARGADTGPLGVALGLWSLALWCGLGGPRLLVTALGATYAAIPIGARPSSSLVLASGRVFAAGLAMAAPVLAVVLLVDLGSSLLLRHEGQGDSVRGVRSLVAVGALALTGAVALAVLGRELGGLRALGVAP